MAPLTAGNLAKNIVPERGAAAREPVKIVRACPGHARRALQVSIDHRLTDCVELWQDSFWP